MSADCRHITRVLGGNRRFQGWTGLALCFLALLVQLLAPTVHGWEVNARQALGSRIASVQALASQASRGATRFVATHPPRRAHDAAVCSVCQTLVRLRDWLTTPHQAFGCPWGVVWLLPWVFFPPVAVFLYVTGARAPPSFP